jgi:hypothetical protein
MKISEMLTPEEIALVKLICRVFKAQLVIIDGVKYKPPKDG